MSVSIDSEMNLDGPLIREKLLLQVSHDEHATINPIVESQT